MGMLRGEINCIQHLSKCTTRSEITVITVLQNSSCGFAFNLVSHSTNVIYLNVRYNLFSLCCGHNLHNCSVLTSWVLRLCHNTTLPARTPRQHKNAAVHCRIMCGLPSDRISALHNCTQPSETEINPLKMACGSPCGREIKIGHTQPSHPVE